MTDKPESLEVLENIILELNRGRSFQSSLANAVKEVANLYEKELSIWYGRVVEHFPVPDQDLLVLKAIPIRSAPLELYERGLKGYPIYESLLDLQKEMLFTLENDYERHLQTLPLKLLFPLIGLIMPSIFLIIIPPLLSELLRSF